MLATLPIVFKANVIQRGGRTARLQHFVDHENFDIHECSAFEAPVAIRSINDLYRTGVYTRWHADRHYVLDGGDVAVSARSAAAPLNEWNASASWRKLVEANDWSRAINDPDLGSRSLADMRSVEESSYEKDRLLTARMAEDFLFVDGRLYRAVGTPAYLLGGIWDRHVGHSFGTEDIRTLASFQRPTEVFAMDRFDDLVAHAEEHYPEMEDFNRAEVIIPESCRFDDEKESLSLAASFCVEMLEDRLKMLDERQGTAWFRLRSAAGSGTPDRLESALREFADACTSPQEDHVGLASDMEDAKAVAERATSRWNVRPLELGEWPGFSL